jgi:hypothetical protein
MKPLVLMYPTLRKFKKLAHRAMVPVDASILNEESVIAC